MAETGVAFAGVARQAEMVRAGEVSPRELVELYLERIERLDPELNAFRVVFAFSESVSCSSVNAVLLVPGGFVPAIARHAVLVFSWRMNTYS